MSLEGLEVWKEARSGEEDGSSGVDGVEGDGVGGGGEGLVEEDVEMLGEGRGEVER